MRDGVCCGDNLHEFEIYVSSWDTMENRAPAEILHLGFNQDYGCFACGTNNGFRVYNCEPFKETFCRGFNNGGIGIVEMLFRCNILAIVGGGAAPKYPPTKVMIWDDHQGKCIGELSFRSQVRSVRLRRDRIVVALEHKVLVYNFADLKLLHQIETLANSKGLVSISSATDITVLACPGLHTGQVRIELYDRRQTKFISAHNNPLSCLCLSLDGKRLATSSEKGTLIRVWNTADGQLLQELRRGADPAAIYSIALSANCEWLAVSSDKGTVHVFALATNVVINPEQTGRASGDAVQSNQSEHRNPTSLFSMVKGLVPIPLPKYFSSEWSYAKFHIPNENGKCIVGFGPQPCTLFVASVSGSFYKIVFDPAKGGACQQESYCKFIDRTSDEL